MEGLHPGSINTNLRRNEGTKNSSSFEGTNVSMMSFLPRTLMEFCDCKYRILPNDFIEE